jgi:hypothetical protein
MLRIALDRYHIDGFRFMSVDINDESEIGRQIAADFFPRIPAVVASHDVPMLLHEQHIGTRAMHGDMMNTVADFGGGIRNKLGP